MTEKPKRAETPHELRSDDGELIPADEDEAIEQDTYIAHSKRTGSS